MIKNTIGGMRRAFDKPELWLIRCVLVAAVIAVVYYSGDKAKDAPTQAILIFLGLAAGGFHLVGAKKACAAWFNRSIGGLFAWSLVICGAIAWEVNSQMGIASQNQDNLSTIQRTAAVKSQTTDAEVNRIAGMLLAKQSESAWKTDPGPLGAIQQRIDGAKANRFWDLTEQCNAPKGPQTRKFCADYRQAEADKAMASRREVLNTEIASLNTELAQARQARMAGPSVASMDRADMRNLKRLTNLSTEDLELSQSLLVVIVMSLFLTVAGWLMKAEEYEGKPRKPWFNWRGYITRIRKLWDGTDHTVVNNHYLSTHTIRTDAGMRPVTMQIA